MEYLKSKNTIYKERAHRSIADDSRKSDHLSKYTSQRDSLLNKHQEYLGQDLKRLIKSDSYRLSMNRKEPRKTSSPSQTMSNLDTIEKQKRLKQQQPHLVVPIEGKRIFNRDSQTYRDEQVFSTVCLTERDDEKGSYIRESPSLMILSKVEEIIQRDLLQFNQMTGRFPNIRQKLNRNRKNLDSNKKQKTWPEKYKQKGRRSQVETLLPSINFIPVSPQLTTYYIHSNKQTNGHDFSPPKMAVRVHKSIDTEEQSFRSQSEVALTRRLNNVGSGEYIYYDESQNDEMIEAPLEKGFLHGESLKPVRSQMLLEPRKKHQAVLPEIVSKNNNGPDKITQDTIEYYHRGKGAVINTNNDDTRNNYDIVDYSSSKFLPNSESNMKQSFSNSSEVYNTWNESNTKDKKLLVSQYPTTRQRQIFKNRFNRFSKDVDRTSSHYKMSTKYSTAHDNIANTDKHWPDIMSETWNSEYLVLSDHRPNTQVKRRSKLHIVIDIPDVTQNSPSPDFSFGDDMECHDQTGNDRKCNEYYPAERLP